VVAAGFSLRRNRVGATFMVAQGFTPLEIPSGEFVTSISNGVYARNLEFGIWNLEFGI